MSVKLSGESMQKKESNFEFGFFKLENNHDKAIVRFLHEDYEDFSRRPVHYVKVPDQKYRVAINCLRADDQPADVCPFCACDVDTSIIGKRSKRIYIEFLVYKIMDKNGKVLKDYTEEPKRMVWEKERKFDDKIFSLTSRYPHICDTVFQVERFGEKGSTETTYDIYPINFDPKDYPFNLPEKLYDPDGIQVKDKTADEMNYYIENEYKFPPTSEDDGEVVERRRDVAQNSTPVQQTEPTVVREEPVQSQVVQPQPASVEQPVQQEPVAQPAVTRRRSI